MDQRQATRNTPSLLPLWYSVHTGSIGTRIFHTGSTDCIRTTVQRVTHAHHPILSKQAVVPGRNYSVPASIIPSTGGGGGKQGPIMDVSSGGEGPLGPCSALSGPETHWTVFKTVSCRWSLLFTTATFLDGDLQSPYLTLSPF